MSTSDRDQRLAAKLRENLRRRKAQSRARTAPAPQSSSQGETKKGTEKGKTGRSE